MRWACLAIAKERPHVILLQECTTDVDEAIAPRLREDGYRALAPGGPSFLNAPYYVAMYTTLPGAAVARPFGCGTRMGRYLLTGALVWRGENLGMLTAHLESLKEGGRQRTLQGEETVAALGACPRAVFGGDTNLRVAEERALSIAMHDANVSDAWMAAGASMDTKYTWDMKLNDSLTMSGNFVPRCRFDQMWSRGLRCVDFRLVGNQRLPGRLKFPSDHFGIVADFELQ